MKVKEDEQLSKYTSFNIGGSAKYFVQIEKIEQLNDALEFAKQKNIKYFIFGEGTNLLVSDQGYDGLIIKLELVDIGIDQKKIFCSAGVKLKNLIQYSIKNDLSGLEELAGIPGSVGGAIWANAGAFRKDISMYVKSVDVLRNGKVLNLKKEQCKFAYRDSIFKKNDDIILNVIIELEKGNQKQSKQKISEILKKRNCSQPLKYPSAGCIFQNFEFESGFVFNYEIPQEFVERKSIPAAWLIDQAGLKGKTIGGAQVSEVHANFIINLNKATAQDVLDLIGLVKKIVKSKFGAELKEEIIYLS